MDAQPLQVRPKQIIFSGDGYVGMTNINWQSWDAQAAVGTGDYYTTNCTPSCVDGKMISQPATIRLSAPVSSKYGREFSELTWTVTGQKAQTLSLA